MDIKTVSLDWDSTKELRALSRKINYRWRELRALAGFGKVIRQPKSKFDACHTIWNTDISDIYSELELDNTNKYYVYAHLDTSTPLEVHHPKEAFAATLGLQYRPFYIGKGDENRCNNLTRSETHRKIVSKLKFLGKEVGISKILESIAECDALAAESKLIDIFGLLPNNGWLCNLDEGHNHADRRRKYINSLLCLHENDWDRLKKQCDIR